MRYNYATPIDSRLSLSPTGNYFGVFSVFNPTGDTSVYNANLWGGGGATLDWTGISWYDPEIEFFSTAVAITKRHVICTLHGTAQAFHNLTWIAADGTRVIRNLMGYRSLLGSDDGLHCFVVFYISEDLPDSIKVYPVMGDRATKLFGMPIVVLHDSPNEIGIANVSSNTYPDINFYSPTEPKRSIYYQEAIPGDSGSPCFMVAGSNLIYITGLVFGGPGTGPSTLDKITVIKNACVELNTEWHDDRNLMPTIWGETFNRGNSILSRMKG